MNISESMLRKLVKKMLLNEYRGASGEFGRSNIRTRKRAERQTDVSEEKFVIADLQLTQADMSGAAAIAQELHNQIGVKGVKEGDEANHQIIVDLVHKPIYKFARGVDMPPEMEQKYVKKLNKKGYAWSAWFLNRCYMGTTVADEIKKNALGFTDSGCCYPYAMAARTRSELFNVPEGMIGQTRLILFSKEEIDATPGLSLKPGVASVVGQGSGDPSWEEIRTAVKLKSGEKHMNVMVSSGNWIGGNLSDSTGVKNDDNKGGYMILVKVDGVNARDSRALASQKNADSYDYVAKKKDSSGENEYQVWKEKSSGVEFWVYQDPTGKEAPVVYSNDTGSLVSVENPGLASYVAAGSSERDSIA